MQTDVADADTTQDTDTPYSWRVTYNIRASSRPAPTTLRADDVRDELAQAVSSFRTIAGTAEVALAMRRSLESSCSTLPPPLAALTVTAYSQASPVSFGNLPATIEPRALAFLSRLPFPALRSIFRAVSLWAAQAPVKAARLTLLTQSADDDVWQEAVAELLVDADTDTAMSLWADLADRIDAVRSTLPDDWRDLTDRTLSFHLCWGDDPW